MTDNPDTPDTSEPENTIDNWWNDREHQDYSWEGLNKKPWHGWRVWVAESNHEYAVLISSEDEPVPYGIDPSPPDAAWKEVRKATLQDYWRADPKSGRLRSDEELMAEGYLVTGADGKIVHIFHRSPDSGTEPAPMTDLLEQEVVARMVCAQRLADRVAKDVPSGDSVDISARFDGGVFPKGLPWSREKREIPPICFNWAFFGEANFHGAKFDGEANFDRAQFVGEANFHGAKFGGLAYFSGAKFGGLAYFSGATFGGKANFTSAKFVGEANFWRAEFEGEADFTSAKFGGEAAFTGAEFGGEANFHEATFGGLASFSSTKFDGKVYFSGATFGGLAYFFDAKFGGPAIFHGVKFGGEANFFKATFGGLADFEKTEFDGKANFLEARFKDKADFYEAKFVGEANFLWATFYGEAGFSEAKFDGEANFRKATFVGEANFSQTTFVGEAHFPWATFDGEAAFTGAEFEDKARFSEAAFGGKAGFSEATFGRDADFRHVRFSGSTKFENARFRADAIFHQAKWTHKDTENIGCESWWQAAFYGVHFAGLLNWNGVRHCHVSAFSGAVIGKAITLSPESDNEAAEHDLALKWAQEAQEAQGARKEREKALYALENGAARLKRALEQEGHMLRAQHFRKLEIRAQCAQAKTSRAIKFFSWGYRTFSDYGLSLSRPLFRLVWVTLVAIPLYWGIGYGLCPSPKWMDAAILSLMNVFRPFAVFFTTSADNAFVHGLLHHSGGWAVLVSLLWIIQSALSVIFLFLLLLALRRRFALS